MKPLHSEPGGQPSAVKAIDILQFHYDDNLGYLLCGQRQALAVDGGAADAMLAYLDQRGLSLTGICQTHGHADHTRGNEALHQATGAPLLDHRECARSGLIPLEDGAIEVIPAPGHTADSVVFRVPGAVLTGDTLFNGTVGNCFSGDLEAFYRSIRRLMALPAATVIWAGHDYVQAALAFARRLEPDNPHHAEYLARYSPTGVCSRLEDELRVNPYLRFDTAPILELLQQRLLPAASSLERWTSLMQIG